MDIRVGRTLEVGSQAEQRPETTGAVEARFLAVRAPRRRAVGPPASTSERREQADQRDPLTGRVLVLLIPDGSRLPEGLQEGAYRIFLRFARR